jgi:hypothetical protein
MFIRSRSLARGLLFLALAAVSVLALAPSPARAEKSFHKLKKRLRKGEHITGVVLCGVGRVVAEALPDEIDLFDTDPVVISSPSSTPPKGGAARPAIAPPPQPKIVPPPQPKPAKPPHPAR